MANFEGGGPRQIAQASVKGTVKWFNATKGYGFITLENGGGDAFCHASALAAAGQQNVPQGPTVVVDLSASPRGMQVTTVHSVDLATADATPSRGGPGGGGRGRFGGGGDRF